MRRLNLIAALIALALSLLASTALAAGSMVSFAAVAEVDPGPVTLLELVAGAEYLDPATRDRLAVKVVGESPALGARTIIEGRKLRAQVLAAGLGRGVSVLIPAQVVITLQKITVTSRQLEEAYREALRGRLGEDSGADIHDIRAGRAIKVPAGRLDFKVTFMGSRLMGRVPAVVRVRVNERTVARCRVVGQVDVYAQVVVAARNLPRHHLITREDLKMVRSNLADARGGACTDPETLMGLRTSGRVSLGQVIDPRRLERAPLIRRGEVVTMIVKTQGLRVTARGKAAQTGYLGGRIKLINLASKRDVYGTVLPNGQVLVEF